MLFQIKKILIIKKKIDRLSYMIYKVFNFNIESKFNITDTID